MSAHVHQASVLNGRSVVLLASFAVPMLFLYGLARNIGVGDILPFDPPLQGSFIDPQPPPTPQPGERAKFDSPFGEQRTELALKRPDLSFPTDEPTDTRTEDSAQVPGGGGGVVIAPAPPTPLRHTATRSTDDFYPPVAIRMGEQGTAQIRVCVDTTGALQGMPTVTATSGYKRLDAAAVTWAREALRFEPATANGAAVAACKGFRVNFRLK